MKTLKLLFGFVLLTSMLTSCTVDAVYIDDGYIEPQLTLNQVLSGHEIWYVDIDRTSGSGQVPFLQRAFTVSFNNGDFYANNNISGIGAAGSGFGIDVGYYDAFNTGVLDVDHDIDGYYTFDVFQINNHEIRLYNPQTNTNYYLVGYQRSNFDFDKLFYDNIEYLLQEYVTWEKVYTSNTGDLNPFDEENFLNFFAGDDPFEFRSSKDTPGTFINNLYYDYSGIYTLYNVAGSPASKNLTLDYDYLGNDYFELDVINDNTIELYHVASSTVYRFRGSGYIQFKQAPGSTIQKRLRTKHIEKDFSERNN